jgi:ribose/xylose/arabinose/galactoside ABC-type transport system permease subunit
LRGLFLRAEGPSLAFLVLLFAVLALSVDGFLNPSNVQSILAQVSVVGIVALSLNQVILSGEIDISVGSVLAVSAFVVGRVAEATGGLLLPLAAGLLVGGLAGVVNGVLVTWGRVPSIIVTLGTLNVLRGGLLFFAASIVLNVPPSSRVLGQGAVGGVQMSVLMLLGVYLLFEFLSRHTTWGRDVLAVGGNETAARYAGVRVGRTRFLAFVAAGLATGFAATVFLGQIGQVQATAATGFELQAIAAVVVGGTSIAGGRGSNLAPLVGAVLIGMILNAMTLLSVPGTLIDLVLGALILAAISTDALRRRLLGRK